MENLRVTSDLVRQAAAEGATYVQTPEMTNLLQRDRAALRAVLAGEDEDISVRAFSALAAELGIVLHVGSLAIALPDGKIANRAFVFGRSGELLARYDKIHLFDVDLPGGQSWRESAVYSPGGEALVVDLPWCRAGISICYDLRFPHLFRAQAHAGAAVLTVPSSFTRQTGEAHWSVLQRARAIENGAFVISAAQAGKHQDGRETFGHSLIVSPWGEVLAEAAGEGPEVILAEIDPAQSTDARQRIPSLLNERAFTAPEAAPPAVQLAS
ncbi:hypothetical protein SAMN05216548_11562 [Faunimonas pinastri]|uniref:CN hydrolase domain-containing protein n=2 Tax=Faunimonas pinastri TaxID=1855383 RepID=A0A1H9NBH5_9HYPH|nr:hypothetical protein SAMN05216548_11562 [Faunimonas pinastri]